MASPHNSGTLRSVSAAVEALLGSPPHFLHVPPGMPLPEPDRLLGEPHATTAVFVHHRCVLRVRLGHPTGEGFPHLSRELFGPKILLSSNDLSITNDEIEGDRAERTSSDLIGPEVVVVGRAANAG